MVTEKYFLSFEYPVQFDDERVATVMLPGAVPYWLLIVADNVSVTPVLPPEISISKLSYP